MENQFDVRTTYKYRKTNNSKTSIARTSKANSNSFLSPYEILPTAQENKYLGEIFAFYHESVCCV